jgi:hypothetical protein
VVTAGAALPRSSVVYGRHLCRLEVTYDAMLKKMRPSFVSPAPKKRNVA